MSLTNSANAQPSRPTSGPSTSSCLCSTESLRAAVVVLPAPLLASLVAVGMVLAPSRVAVGALSPASKVAVGALLPLGVPLALPAPTANLPDCWRLLPRVTRANHPGRCHQQQNSPAQAPSQAPSSSDLHPALACSAMTTWDELSPYPTSHGQVGHGVPPRTGGCPAGTTPTCSPLPAASSPANGAYARPPAHHPHPTGRSRPRRTSTRRGPSSCPRGISAWAGRTQQQQTRPGEHPRTLPVGERRPPFLLRVLALVPGTLGRRASRRWPKPLWHISATSL